MTVSIRILPSHPKPLSGLLSTTFFERIAYLGMQSLLVLFLSKHLFTEPHIQAVWGAGFVQRATGADSSQSLASYIFGAFTALNLVLPLLGGFIADRFLGLKRTIAAGGILMMLGYTALTWDAAFFAALALIALGNGMFKPNLASAIGGLYQGADGRAVDAFQLLIITAGLAGLISPLLIGTAGESYSWSYGFLGSAVAIAIGVAVHWRQYPSVAHASEPRNGETGADADDDETDARGSPLRLFWWSAMLAVLVLPNYQIFNAYMMWADVNFDRQLFGGTFPSSWIVLLAGGASMTANLAVMKFWEVWRQRWVEPTNELKILFGMILVLFGTACLVVAAFNQNPGEKISLILPIAFHILLALGSANIVPLILAQFSRIAPSHLRSATMGIFYLSMGVGSLLVGWTGGYYTTLSATMFWGMHSATIAVLCLLYSAVIFRPRHAHFGKKRSV